MIRVFGVNTKKSKFDTEEKIMDFSLLTPDKQVKYQYWLHVIHECRSSGLTNQDWCEQNGISLKSYYYWISKLRKLAVEDLPRKEYISSAKSSDPTGNEFVELPTPVKMEHVGSSKPAAVLKKGNVSVELYETTTESFLQMLIKVVQKC